MKIEEDVGEEMFRHDQKSYWIAYELSNSFGIGFMTYNHIRCFWSISFGSFSSGNWSHHF
jgi:hypothetical protein